MGIIRRVVAIVAVVAALALVATPAAADGRSADGRSADGQPLVQVGLDSRVVQLVADGDGTCALTENGQVYCWGEGRPGRPAHNALLLIAIGSLLIGGGATLLLFSRSS